jgi:uncharacterized protein
VAASESSIRFLSGDITLDGRIAIPADIADVAGAANACVVCHPHPLYGGDMHSAVVVAVTRALADRGIATLRFDFRGVGLSGGRHGGGSDEIGDARAAVDALSQHSGAARIAIAGYSFGAYVALKLAEIDPRIVAVAAIAPPFAMAGAQQIAPPELPLLLLCGDDDAYCPSAEARAFAADRPSTRLVMMAGADHFLAGREAAAASEVAAFIAGI